jgi:regulatory protein
VAAEPVPDDVLQQALELAYRQLGRRDRTIAELRWYLRRRVSDHAAVEGAIRELLEQGYLDDARYAQRFAEDRRTLDGWGAERIARRLSEAGVAPDIVDALLDERDSEDELSAAVAILRRRIGAPPDDDRGRERALGLLVRRGYELELAYDAVRAFERDVDAA